MATDWRSPWDLFSDLMASVIPKPETFMTEDQIVDDLCSKLDEKSLTSWLWIRREDVILGHNSTGRAIRNQYKLHHSGNPHVVLDDGNHPNFPDQMSTRIMKRVWDRVRGLAEARGLDIPTLEQIDVRAKQEREAEQAFFRSMYSYSGRARQG